ncbi:citrate synthase [Stella humosa]|uniref:Citrate synthase n=1 Tax=Stella humosa TaxID=94 RepID=A0A3N1MCC4_9PROT|nr:citrate synthase [Stella humosa]ROQ00400.1 citrate synthase [Stella humosa]BBK30357.1 citrate synthase [Stella humosa]
MAVGLDDVVAAETVLSHVDGQAGRLVLRGFELEELAGRRSYEDVLALLWDGFVAIDGLPAALGQARAAAFAILEPRLGALDGLSAIEAVRAGLALLPDAATVPHHLLATAMTAVTAAAAARRAAGEAAVAPDPVLGHAADFLRMLHGRAAPAAHVRALDTYLVTIADHGLNASTFAARVVASTRAGLLSAVVAGVCALKGPLHGGAPGPVLDMLDEIGPPENVEPWLAAALDRGDRLMGFGHRVYRVRDPRADVLKRVVMELRGEANRIRFAEQVEATAIRLLAQRKQGRGLDTNVEFYTALLLEALALPRTLFTPIFAVGRVGGWAAHVLEQEESRRIIRPQSAYVGPEPRQAA